MAKLEANYLNACSNYNKIEMGKNKLNVIATADMWLQSDQDQELGTPIIQSLKE